MSVSMQNKLDEIATAYVNELSKDLVNPELANKPTEATPSTIASIAKYSAFTCFADGELTEEQKEYVYEKALVMAQDLLPWMIDEYDYNMVCGRSA